MKFVQSLGLRWRSMAVAFAISFASTVVFADAAPSVHVHWTDPSAFAEVRDNACRSRPHPEEWLGDLAKYLQRRGADVLIDGQRLDITITDLRRAGACEPWHGPQTDDVRVIRDIYPPRIDLRFSLSATDGTPIREGDAHLRDAAFMHRGTLSRSDPLRYEKRVLDDWLQREFVRKSD